MKSQHVATSQMMSLSRDEMRIVSSAQIAILHITSSGRQIN